MALFAYVLHMFAVFLSGASLDADLCVHGACAASAEARSGGAMIQKKSIMSTAKASDVPDEQYIKLTTRLTTMEARVGTLEEESSQGREALKAQLAALTTDVDTMKSSGTGSLDDTTSRVGEAEGMVSNLADVVDEGNAAVREGIEALREQYNALAKNVGDAFASLSALQIDSKPKHKQHTHEHASVSVQVSAKDAPVGGSLIERTTALEGRVDTLESASDEEREALRLETEALDKRVDSLKAGGVGSLEHTKSRVGSAEQSVSSLRASVSETNAALKNDLDSLASSVDALSEKVGSLALLQEPQLPLTTRIDGLETRIVALEDKSRRGRGLLENAMTSLSEKIEDMKTASGVSSLEHTTLRQDGVEADIANLQAFVKEERERLESSTASLKAKLDGLQSRVGASLLEAA